MVINDNGETVNLIYKTIILYFYHSFACILIEYKSMAIDNIYKSVLRG